MNFNKKLLKKAGVYVAVFICGYAARYGVKYFQAKQKAQSYIFNDLGKTNTNTALHKSAEYGFVPREDILKLSEGAVPDAKTAANFALNVLSPICGDKEIQKQIPFDVILINDIIWCVTGCPPKHEGGNFCIWIQKQDGRVLDYWHSK